MAVYDEGFAPAAATPRFTNVMNYAGAAMSLALILGVGFWGYKLIVRDVSGIPVVRAMEGDMRVLPDNPGGDVALHTGLAVNEVAASGEAGGPEDRLVLAPSTPGLAAEDLEAQPVAAAIEAAMVTDTSAQDDIAALAAALSNSAAAATTAEAPAPAAPSVEAAPNPLVLPASVPGVVTSLRPALRPASLRTVAAAPVTPAEPAAPAGEVAVTSASFPSGTNLVQLGAFASPTLAAQEWERLQAGFGELIANRAHFIQVSNQSGGTWYRLRASGFADRAEARRLCAALSAEGANCIAVTVN